MALTYEEQIMLELEKIKELKRKIKAEEKRNHTRLGELLASRIEGITPSTFDEEMVKFSTSGLDDDFVICADLGEKIMKRLPKYFNLGTADYFAETVEKLAAFLEQNDV